MYNITENRDSSYSQIWILTVYQNFGFKKLKIEICDWSFAERKENINKM